MGINGAIDTSTALSSFGTGGNPRSAATVDGSAFWLASGANGIHYAALGASTSTGVQTAVSNMRVTQIFNNQLYVSSASGALRLGTVGIGLPTSSGQTVTNLPGFPTTGSPYGFFFADLDAGVAGLDTLYVADDGGTLQKYCLVGGSWSARGTATAAGVRGLTGSVSGSTVTLYGVTGATSAGGGGTLYRFIDSTGYNNNISGAATSLASAAANTAFRGVAFAPGNLGGPATPAVASTTPADNAINVSPAASISITFNSAVSVVPGSWFTINGSISGSHTASVSGGPTTFTLVPSPFFAEGETVTVNVLAAQVTDFATNTVHPVADYPFAFDTQTLNPLPIHTIQGSGTASAYVGQGVTVQGIVTGIYPSAEPDRAGFYVQAAEADYDNDPWTSEGMFINSPNFPVSIGNVVKASGTIEERPSSGVTSTRMVSVSFVSVQGNAPLPTPVPLTLPFTSLTSPEPLEGMRVTLPQTLTVTENFALGRFGEVLLSTTRLSNPTNVVAPGGPAIALAASNQLNQIILDDSLDEEDPDPTPGLADSAGRGLTRRTGSTVAGASGVLDNRFGGYIVEAATWPSFTDAFPRGDPTPVAGTLKVAIGNVLNFFNGNGAGGGFPTARGASNLAEFQRQRAKIVAGIIAVLPDIMGLTEVENDGYGPTSALADLVNGLNAAAPSGVVYAAVDASAVEITTDLVHCAFVYRTDRVATVGGAAMLSHPAFNDLSRNPLAQTFQQLSNGEKLTVCINHFRAKGGAATSPAATGGISPNPNLDQGDGQGNNNYLRVLQANALTAWLATDPTASGDPDFLIIGDLNAYAKEDPITAIEGAGYVNLTEAAEGVGGWSYQFGGEFGHLDHALASDHLAGQVMDAATWHVNADEPVFYDYNTEFKSPTQQAINATGPYRYSDHDPVVVGLNLQPDPAADVLAQLQITRSTITKNLLTKRYMQNFTVKNIGATPLNSPVTIILAGLSPNATLFNPAGFTSVITPLGSPYFNLKVGADNMLTPGESVLYVVEWTNPTNAPITYTIKAVAGPGGR